jgi:hypothetical protein
MVSVASVAIGTSLSEIKVDRKNGEARALASDCGGRTGINRHSPFLSSGPASGEVRGEVAAPSVRDVPGSRHTDRPSTAGHTHAVVMWVSLRESLSELEAMSRVFGTRSEKGAPRLPVGFNLAPGTRPV